MERGARCGLVEGRFVLRLRLFRKDDPGVQIDSRPLGDGELVIGRDAKCDWAIADPERGISRRHLTIVNRGGLVTVRDTSSNGVFLADQRERVPQDRAVPIERGEAVRFGGYVLVLEEDQREAAVATPFAQAPFERSDDRGRGTDTAQRRDRHPFASALKPDPFGAQGEVGDADAWDRRKEAPAGSWDAGARRAPEHNELIGAERRWTEPAPPQRESGYGFDTPFERPILERVVTPAQASAIPSDWMDSAPGEAPETAGPAAVPIDTPTAVPASAPPTSAPSPAAPASAEVRAAAPTSPPASAVAGDDALFQHFCAGAGLNPQHFAGEDRGQVMERLGGIYRQAVIGIADLMRERTTLRNEYRMVHTAVQPEGNNPFKGVPPQRIAVELLRNEDSGYTTGERALNDALHDIKAHLLCTLAGMRTALAATFGALAPAQVEAKLGGRSYLISVQRDAALWAEYVALAEALRREAEDNADGLINRAFRQGYEDQAAELISSAGTWR